MSDKEEIKFDSALVIRMKDALVAEGSQRLEKQRRQSNSNPDMLKKNSSSYKGKKNLLGENGTSLKSFNCKREYHFDQKCDKKKKDREE